MPSKQQSRRPALLARLFSAVRETSAPAPDSFGGLKNIFQGLVLISDRWPPHSASRWTHPGQDGATAPKIGPCPCPGAQHSWLPKFEVFRLDRRFCSRAKDICDAAELKTHLQHPLHLCRAFQLRLEAVGHLVEEVTLAAVGSGGVQGAGGGGGGGAESAPGARARTGVEARSPPPRAPARRGTPRRARRARPVQPVSRPGRWCGTRGGTRGKRGARWAHTLPRAARHPRGQISACARRTPHRTTPSGASGHMRGVALEARAQRGRGGARRTSSRPRCAWPCCHPCRRARARRRAAACALCARRWTWRTPRTPRARRRPSLRTGARTHGLAVLSYRRHHFFLLLLFFYEHFPPAASHWPPRRMAAHFQPIAPTIHSRHLAWPAALHHDGS